MRNLETEFCEIGAKALFCLGLFALGCSDDPLATGSLTVRLESEDVIVEGLQPGDGSEDIADGWAVDFEKYVATIGDIDLHLSSDESVEAEASEVFVVDLALVPAEGIPLWNFDDLQAGRWEFHYATPEPDAGSSRHESVGQSDFDEMVANDWTYLVEGMLTKSDGQSCPPSVLVSSEGRTPNGNVSGDNECFDASTIRFSWGASAETSFGPCEIDGVPGFAVAPNGTQTVTATIHGDHLFFNGFPEGDEGGVSRLAQWLADSDLDLDGTVTREELEAISPSQLSEIDDRYQLGGSPVTPLENMYDYVSSQLKTQGHFQGEGECPVDGVEHDHDDE